VEEEGGPVDEARSRAGVPASNGAGATGVGSGRVARSCVSRGEGGRETSRWAIRRGGAQLAVGREAMTGGPVFKFNPNSMIQTIRA
jgi:hypothetical protein